MQRFVSWSRALILPRRGASPQQAELAEHDGVRYATLTEEVRGDDHLVTQAVLECMRAATDTARPGDELGTVRAKWRVGMDGTLEWDGLRPHNLDWTDVAEVQYVAKGQPRTYVRANCQRYYMIWPGMES
jgi:hypothetical protein